GYYGFVSGMGNDILFSRNPIHNLDELRKTRLWVWSLDSTLIAQFKALGIPTVSTEVGDAMKAYDDGRVDAFISIPLGALAYQWSARTRYFTDFHFSFLPGCLVIANHSFDALGLDEQQAIREAAAKLTVRFEDLGRTLERKLTNGLFQRQGTRPQPASPLFRAQLFSAAEDARQHIP